MLASTAPRDLATLWEAAFFLELSEDALYRRCRRGGIPGATQLGSKWVVPVATLERFTTGLAAVQLARWKRREIDVIRPANRSAGPHKLTMVASVIVTTANDRTSRRLLPGGGSATSDGIGNVRSNPEKAA